MVAEFMMGSYLTLMQCHPFIYILTFVVMCTSRANKAVLGVIDDAMAAKLFTYRWFVEREYTDDFLPQQICNA